MSTTATVETLTAEVRVLMVGNRQVTLSVYRQLDRVGVGGICPFGRVNPDRDNPPGRIYVVGKDVRDGTLVRALIVRYRIAEEYADSVATEEWVALYDQWAKLPLIVLAGLK